MIFYGFYIRKKLLFIEKKITINTINKFYKYELKKNKKICWINILFINKKNYSMKNWFLFDISL